MLARVVSNPLMLVGMAVIGMLTGPIAEELGWRGFALERLQVRWSPLVSSLILAPLWWGWHLPLFFMKGTTQYAWGLFTPLFWFFLVGTVPLAIVFTWVCNHNGKSILAAILAHFTYNLTFSLVHPFSVSVYAFHVILMFVVAGAMVLGDRFRLGLIPHPASSGALRDQRR
jgi:membrane protease YdiL (CAAX protease family)